MDADGLALLFWVGLAGIAVLVAAGGLEWLLSRPDRRWLRRMRDLERARIDWAARCVRDQAFWKE